MNAIIHKPAGETPTQKGKRLLDEALQAAFQAQQHAAHERPMMAMNCANRAIALLSEAGFDPQEYAELRALLTDKKVVIQ